MMTCIRNIVLICLDSVRKDYFDDFAPRLQNLSDVSFEQCRVASSWSLPSHGSMLTGTLPSEHNAHSHHLTYSHIPVEDRFIAELPNHTKIGVSANTYASPEFDFDRGFDRFKTISTFQRRPDGTNPKSLDVRRSGRLYPYIDFLRQAATQEHPIDTTLNAILGILDNKSKSWPVPKLLDDGATAISKTVLNELDSINDPYFVFTNYMDTHLPFQPTRGYDTDFFEASANWSTRDFDQWEMMYDPDNEYEKNLKHLYSASIDYLDRHLEEVIQILLESGSRETTVIITADHGDNLGFEEEDGLFRHRSSLSEGLLHVPLYIVNPPDGYNTVEESYFSHLNLGELIVGLAHGNTPDVFAEEIVAEVVGWKGASHAPSDFEYWDRMIRCVYRNKTKIEWDSLGNVRKFKIDFNKPSYQSVCECDSVVSELEATWFDEPIQTFKENVGEFEDGTDIDEVTEDRLRNLGYL